MTVYCLIWFFFQAEDGIRDLVRSRGLGDVYKRQGGQGLISGRKAFQRPMKEGVQLLNAIQDVYLDKKVTIA